MIYIDPPRWPGHGTLWSHLISDQSYEELHVFARALGLPRRSFDLDHYDVPERLYGAAVAAGALPVEARAVVERLTASELRVRQRDRARVTPARRATYLREEWQALGSRLFPGREQDRTDWTRRGEFLLEAWSSPSRHYHTDRHLEDVLLALDLLSTNGEEVSVEALAAAWYHDAVYTGRAGTDEAESADLARRDLEDAGADPRVAATVAAYILATTPPNTAVRLLERDHGVDDVADLVGAAPFLDADLAILGARPERYSAYTRMIRAEYAHVDETAYAQGRTRILESYRAREEIYRTATARRFWDAQARRNLDAEIAELRSSISASSTTWPASSS